ncbi:peroxisomal catalase 1-like [Ostrinia furnacalis]|uniref:peroxisomal catalase 1-like n=1 Tax=Ostrinia furnacalis TaxID=93504 RepID=UPI001039D196|nr:peroxisomal catalase 1-like [Ostrinia furnacalis]
MRGVSVLLLWSVVDLSTQYVYDNVTIDYVPRQLTQFKEEHPKPIGVLTTTAGAPVDIRQTITMNTDIFSNTYHMDTTSNSDVRQIPERTVHARGFGAHGYFEVTHDVSKYTSADVFNGIGKKTPLFGRFSTAIQNKGGQELGREIKGLAVKLYTQEGNLDFLNLHLPVYLYRDPVDFAHFVRSFRRNPKTNVIDYTMIWDFISQRPDVLNNFMWLHSDYGIPDGYRRMDIFPLHTYEITNKHGESFFVKFNFRTELGLANLTTAQAQAIASQDPDYFTRDVYNSIANKKYPSWRLDMDIMTPEQVLHLDYNPFDVTRLWKRGTFKTVTIGRLVLNKHADNDFRDTEQSAYNPANLVPGIPGPVDNMFRARRFAYRDAHKYRLGGNHDNIEINHPKYTKVYNRDGQAPVRDNVHDAPVYYPNTFNGPEPIVDLSHPKVRKHMWDRNSVDLQPNSEFYNDILENDAHRQRLADNLAATLVNVDRRVVKNALSLLSMVSKDLGHRVTVSYKAAQERANAAAKLDAQTRYEPLARCVSLFAQGRLK